MTLIENIRLLLQSLATKQSSGGQFKEVVSLEGGRDVVYEFPQATGMAWSAKKFSYSGHFGEVPNWVQLLHPSHRVRVCQLSLDAGQALPQMIDEEFMAHYFSKGRIKKTSLPEALVASDQDLGELHQVSKISDEHVLAVFEVDDSGTLKAADFSEPKIRAEFYVSVHESWSHSPLHLADSMRDCEPLAWSIQSIYTKIRNEIQADLDDVGEGAETFEKRISVLKARLQEMPEEPEEGVEDWLLALTNKEFIEQIVPEIEKWFASSPNWIWEVDHLPRDGTAQGAALKFFQNIDGDTLDALGVTIVEGEHPGSTYYAAELKGDVDAANNAALTLDMSVKFKKVDRQP